MLMLVRFRLMSGVKMLMVAELGTMTVFRAIDPVTMTVVMVVFMFMFVGVAVNQLTVPMEMIVKMPVFMPVLMPMLQFEDRARTVTFIAERQQVE